MIESMNLGFRNPSGPKKTGCLFSLLSSAVELKRIRVKKKKYVLGACLAPC